MDITKGIQPLTEFKRDTARFLARLKETSRPSILTVNGRPELVVMDADSWQDTQDQIEFAGTMSGIRKGIEQAKQDASVDAASFFETLDPAKK